MNVSCAGSILGAVSVTNHSTTRLRDSDVPAVRVLLADGVPLPLTTVFAEAGVTVEQAVATQVTWWPGKSVTVRYRARCTGTLQGEHQIVACSGDIPGGAAVVEGGGIRIGVWSVPYDPALPGLAAALDPRTVGRLVRDLGMPGGRVRTRLRAYRPGRRAVVEVRGERTLAYLKLVRPTEVERIHRSHVDLAARLPVAPSLGLDVGLGVLALRAMPGFTLRQTLEDPEAVLPTAGELEALLDALPAPHDTRRSPSPIEQLPALSELLSLILPGEKGRVGDLVARIGDDTQPAEVAVHGDFHDAQLLIDRGNVVGILDIDTFGQGRSGDDPATMIGHLAVLQTTSAHPDRVGEYAATLLRMWDQAVDPVDLRRRTAAVIMGLATGPFRVQRGTWPIEVRRRLDLAEHWVESADRVRENNLMATSRMPHPGAPLLESSNRY
jgi:hypothetical protein